MKVLLSLLAVPVLLALAGSQAFGQQVAMGEAPHETVQIAIDEAGNAHVTHVVNNTLTIFKPVQVDLVAGDMSNLTVTDGSGSAVEYGTVQKSPVSIMLTASQRNMTLIKYDLAGAVTNTGGVWKWNYYEPQDTGFTAFYFPKGVDMIWANDRPVYLGEHGLGQHGNGFTLEYVINEPVTVQKVQVDGKSFAVGIRTVAGVGDYAFDQSLNTYSFNVDKGGVPVTVIMPKDLLNGPYTATINGNATLHQEFNSNATHAWIGLKPAKSGTVEVKGTAGGGQQVGPPSNTATVTGEGTQPGTADNTAYIVIGGVIAAGIAGLVMVKRSRSRETPKAGTA